MNSPRSLRIAALLLPLYAGDALRAEDPPAIRVEGAKFDFGSIVFGQKVQHGFVVRNQGGSPLVISEVISRCDCFHASFEKTIAPGQSGRIETTIDTADLQGPVFLTIGLRSNDPERKLATFEITGFVNGPIMLLPGDHVDLTTVQGEDKQKTVVLEVNRKQPLQVKGVESSSPVFTARLETSKPGRRYRIVVTAAGSQPPGLHKGTIRLRTDDPKQPVMALECGLLVLASVVVEPSALYLPPLDQADARKGMARKDWKVQLRNVRKRPFTIVSITSDLPFVGARSEPRSDTGSFDLFVEIRPNEMLRPGRTISSLHVKTSLPDAQDVRIPVWIEVR